MGGGADTKPHSPSSRRCPDPGSGRSTRPSGTCTCIGPTAACTSCPGHPRSVTNEPARTADRGSRCPHRRSQLEPRALLTPPPLPSSLPAYASATATESARRSWCPHSHSGPARALCSQAEGSPSRLASRRSPARASFRLCSPRVSLTNARFAPGPPRAPLRGGASQGW